MIARRLFKQILIVAIALSLLFGAMTGLFFLLIRPPVPAAPIASPSPSFSPITVEKVHVIPHSESAGLNQQTIDLVAQVRNSNSTAGVASYLLTFIVRDAEGNVIVSRTEPTYLLPSSLRYVATLDVPVGTKAVGNVEIQLPENPVFTNIPSAIKLPEFNVFLKELSRRTLGSLKIEEQRAVIRNVGTLNWERVEITAVALSATNDVIGVGKTFVGALDNTEEREFTLQWPEPSVSTVRVVAIPSTNIFADDNLIRVIGDPNSLR